MASGNAVWGIEIGQCALKALKLRAVGDELELVAFDLIEHLKAEQARGRTHVLLDEEAREGLRELYIKAREQKASPSAPRDGLGNDQSKHRARGNASASGSPASEAASMAGGRARVCCGLLRRC